MELVVRNADGHLAARDREYAEKKLSRLDRLFNSANKVELAHRMEKGSHKLAVTVFADGKILRGEDTDSSLRAAIDKVAEKVGIQLRRAKLKLVKPHRKLKVA